MILMRAIRSTSSHRGYVLMRKRNLQRKFVGLMARCLGTIPVDFIWDHAKPARGTIHQPDYTTNPFLVQGFGTHFDAEAEVGGLLIVPSIRGGVAAREIAEILGPEELLLKNCFGQMQIEKYLSVNEDASGRRGAAFKLAPKADHTELQETVLEKLDEGASVCLFPEGASHDSSQFLPFKC
jgi:glycerol-3-phosphate O-acyltransferase/dihydroxyacetone phosphate acyltransferase